RAPSHHRGTRLAIIGTEASPPRVLAREDASTNRLLIGESECPMAENLKLTHPWLVAVWPGMGHVALNAGVYLLAKLGMTVIAEFEASDLFDVDHVEVKNGLVQTARRPRNRFFVWVDPNKKHDVVVFLGEAQPPVG